MTTETTSATAGAAKHVLILGGHASGKTAALAQCAVDFAKPDNPKGGSVLFVCASPLAAKRLAFEEGSRITATDARCLAQKILQGQPRTRLLVPYEEQVLFEDLRTCGLPQKQIRKVLAFVYANMASCGDWNPDWIEMREERLVYDTLMGTLAFTGGTVEPELANRAARLLKKNPKLQLQASFDYVVVDDYGLLNRSSQVMCNLLARKGIVVAGEPGFSLAVHDSHPNPQGLEEFALAHPDAETVNLGTGTERRPHVEYCTPDTLKDEFSEIARRVQDAVASGVAPQRIAVMGTNRIWLRNMARFLEQETAIPLQQAPRNIRIQSFTDERGYAAARADAQARLAQNPTDGVALRSLFAFGDYLARSLEVKQMRQEHPGSSIADLVSPSQFETGETPSAAPAEVPVDGNSEAASASQDAGIWVASPTESFARTFDLVIYGGLVPGWLPGTGYADAVGSKRQQFMDDAALNVSCAKRAAESALVLSGFRECGLEFAERYGLHYRKSRLVKGVRTCIVERTFECIPELFGRP